MVVQERKVFLVGGGPAAGVVADLLPPPAQPLLHGGERDVVVAAAGRAFATAVPEEDDLVTLVAQLELAHGHLLVLQRAASPLPGALSPFALAGVPPGLSFHQGPDNLLEFSLCEALENVHDWEEDKKRGMGRTIA